MFCDKKLILCVSSFATHVVASSSRRARRACLNNTPCSYEMLLVCAAKTAASALRLPRGPAGNAPLLSSGALETTAYAYSLIQSRSTRRKGSFGTSRDVRCVCKVRSPCCVGRGIFILSFMTKGGGVNDFVGFFVRSGGVTCWDACSATRRHTFEETPSFLSLFRNHVVRKRQKCPERLFFAEDLNSSPLRPRQPTTTR